ncbi:SLC13 family permease [Zunongwangia profunda]|jgi:di/tricarboxylate transporter|uniref:SLC13 family permease n=1 Tax=Zunongwangia profunda TaxID=398743 RepID=UPI001D18CAC6|nr:SLC13 family permease [Zunongwangia profunda]MCC4229871.1 SLC13 family permease [Zunongwangia profunda]|tara:strand:+ start:1257 stop:3047 length:1791 start_codon:yes stop_codon:yes gene_type:complete
MELYITAAIIFIGIFLFIKDYFSIDTTSILIMALFIVSGVLSPEEGFSGFNHPATITLGCMFVVSAAIFKSGIIDSFSDKIIRIAKINYVFALMIFCFSAALFSAFINDTAVVAILIPMALLVCRETGINPSRLLIPISFSALFGGTCTLIGTSTNILVSGIAKKSGLEPFNMFEFTLPALCLLAIGLTYLIMVGPWLLPKRAGAHESGLTKEAQNYLAEVVLGKDSTDVDHAIVQSKLVSQYGAQILSIKRNHHRMYEINGDTILRAEDSMKILIDPQHLSQLMDKGGYTLIGDKTNLLESENKKDNKDEKTIYEVMIPYGSPLAERSLRQLNFRNIYYASVLALRHRKEIITQDFSNVVLKEGDMLLLYAAQKDIQALTSRKLMVVLSNYQAKKVNYKKAIPALLITLGVVLSAALNLTSILISAMVGSLLLVTTSILKPKEAYDAIEWKVIFMMAGVLSMGKALEKTGGSELISQFIFEQIGDLNPSIILSLVFLITFLSTNILSSKAAAALMAPIVISLAGALQLSEKPFLIGVMFACSLTFMTPVSYPTNTMVYGAGNYKFNDFLKFGTPLNFIIWIAASFIIPVFFPFEV